MNIERVQKQLELDEGVEHRIYHDHLGLATFGIGHLVLTSDPEFSLEIGTPVTPERVATAFAEDLAIAENECKVLYYFWEELPEEVQEILVNMMFNLGRPRLSKFKKMNAHIEDENWRCAAVEGRDSRWYRQVGQRAERLMVRMENV
jgi:lysozyme|tara:strand:- start:977 stop:1417 length:441 start_codon:yes stop_codon:yes gene_type:complete